MKKLLPFFISFILLSSFILSLIPNEVRAETTYVDVDFEDGTNGLFSDSAGFTIEQQSVSNRILHLSATTTNHMDGDMVSVSPTTFEISLDFKLVSTNGNVVLICVSGNPKGTSYNVLNLYVDANGNLLANTGNDTGYDVEDNIWHHLFINVTSNNVMWISLDNDIPWHGSYVGSFINRQYIHIGTFANVAVDCYWDNITMVSRIGSLPIADFEHTPSKGDGLTNFIFTDTSTIDNILFPVSYNWTFGDGNYTLTKNANHTYIFEGTYQVILNVSNRFGYDLAYTNITVTGISIGGGEEVSDDMFGFIALLAMITALNLYAMKSSTGLLSIFALMGLIISASLLWPDSPITTALLMVTVLGNIAITIKTVT